jgi:UDP-N-acetylmuramate dehydrogenase
MKPGREAFALRLASAGFRGAVLEDEPLAPRSTFRIGGAARLLLEPSDAESLAAVVSVCRGADEPFFMLGGGSNVVFPDGAFNRVVVSTGYIGGIIANNGSTGQEAIVSCGSGCAMAQLAAYALESALGGLEAFAGLPGTVGGAVFMNARCYEREVSDVLAAADYLPASGDALPKRYAFDGRGWGYKRSPFQHGVVIVGAEFALRRLSGAEAQASRERAAGYIADRERKGHFRYPSAGSVFKNSRAFGKPSGQLIDEAGLCGFRIGGAQIAPWHGNIIVNTGGATAADVWALAEHARRAVQERFGFRLEREIIFA